jgi:hypothetical protein
VGSSTFHTPLLSLAHIRQLDLRLPRILRFPR